MATGQQCVPEHRSRLETLYARFNRREFVHPDPLEVLYAYPEVADRELVALVASSLAYGRVAQILVSVRRVLDRMGPAPHRYLLSSTRSSLRRDFAGFKHRFSTEGELVDLLDGARTAIEAHGSLNACFRGGLEPDAHTVLNAAERFACEVAGCDSSLLSCPARGSACKRLHLFLRWMVRADDVDPGGWAGVSPAQLIVPLDTHMFRVARSLGLTRRNTADRRAAVEVTEGFRQYAPDDPVKYDFALTRSGIWKNSGDATRDVSRPPDASAPSARGSSRPDDGRR